MCGLKLNKEEILGKILVTPFVGVWIETDDDQLYVGMVKSHPSWVCGLKRDTDKQVINASLSHPSWVCGLKPSVMEGSNVNGCHTLRGCVDINEWIKCRRI